MKEIAEQKRIQKIYTKMKRDTIRFLLFAVVFIGIIGAGLYFTAKAVGGGLEPRQWGNERFEKK
jgi:hypothetical protein